MVDIAKPVSNIPLTCPSIPGKVVEIKGCKFTPAVYLTRGRLYYIYVGPRSFEQVPQIPGFYDVPEKSYLAWIDHFKVIAGAAKSRAGNNCFIFEAFEGTPPNDFVPQPTGLGVIRSEKIEVKPIMRH